MVAPSVEELSDLELFRDLTDEERTTIAGWFDVEEVSPGQRLTRQEANGYSFIVLRHGAATVSVDGEVVRTLALGDFIGEISLLFGPAQTATVVATVPCIIWRMFGTHFRMLQQQFPRIADLLEATAQARQQVEAPAD